MVPLAPEPKPLVAVLTGLLPPKVNDLLGGVPKKLAAVTGGTAANIDCLVLGTTNPEDAVVLGVEKLPKVVTLDELPNPVEETVPVPKVEVTVVLEPKEAALEAKAPGVPKPSCCVLDETGAPKIDGADVVVLETPAGTVVLEPKPDPNWLLVPYPEGAEVVLDPNCGILEDLVNCEAVEAAAAVPNPNCDALELVVVPAEPNCTAVLATPYWGGLENVPGPNCGGFEDVVILVP